MNHSPTDYHHSLNLIAGPRVAPISEVILNFNMAIYLNGDLKAET